MLGFILGFFFAFICDSLLCVWLDHCQTKNKPPRRKIRFRR